MSIQLSKPISGYNQADVKIANSQNLMVLSAGVYDNVPHTLSFLSIDDQLNFGSTCKGANELVNIEMSEFYFGRLLIANKKITQVYLASMRKFARDNDWVKDHLQMIKENYSFERSIFSEHSRLLKNRKEAQEVLTSAETQFTLLGHRKDAIGDTYYQSLKICDEALTNLNLEGTQIIEISDNNNSALTDEMLETITSRDYTQSAAFRNSAQTIVENYSSQLKDTQAEIDERQKNFFGWLVSKINGKTGFLGLIDKIVKFLFQSVRNEASLQNELNEKYSEINRVLKNARIKLQLTTAQLNHANAEDTLRQNREALSKTEIVYREADAKLQQAHIQLQLCITELAHIDNSIVKASAALKEANDALKVAISKLTEYVPEYQNYINSQEAIKFLEPTFSVFGSEMFLNKIAFYDATFVIFHTESKCFFLEKEEQQQSIYNRKDENLVSFSNFVTHVFRMALKKAPAEKLSPYTFFYGLRSKILPFQPLDFDDKVVMHWLSHLKGRISIQLQPPVIPLANA